MQKGVFEYTMAPVSDWIMSGALSNRPWAGVNQVFEEHIQEGIQEITVCFHSCLMHTTPMMKTHTQDREPQQYTRTETRKPTNRALDARSSSRNVDRLYEARGAAEDTQGEKACRFVAATITITLPPPPPPPPPPLLPPPSWQSVSPLFPLVPATAPAPKLGRLVHPDVRVGVSYEPAFKTIYKAAFKKKIKRQLSKKISGKARRKKICSARARKASRPPRAPPRPADAPPPAHCPPRPPPAGNSNLKIKAQSVIFGNIKTELPTSREREREVECRSLLL
jgi:hypothetical protein